MDTRTHIEKINDVHNEIAASFISHSSVVSQIRNALISELASGKKLDRDESINAGKELRKKVPRSSHAAWDVKPDRSEIVDMISEQEKTRIPELIPVRHQRMKGDVFIDAMEAFAKSYADQNEADYNVFLNSLK